MTKRSRRNCNQWEHLTPKLLSTNVPGVPLSFFGFPLLKNNQNLKILRVFNYCPDWWIVGVKNKKWLLDATCWKKVSLWCQCQSVLSCGERKMKNKVSAETRTEKLRKAQTELVFRCWSEKHQMNRHIKNIWD